jgi:SAM-dependent methyltransferase
MKGVRSHIAHHRQSLRRFFFAVVFGGILTSVLFFTSPSTGARLLGPITHNGSIPLDEEGGNRAHTGYRQATRSYSAHTSHIMQGERHVFDSDASMKGYLDPSLLDQRRHAYMLSAAEPLLQKNPRSYWLTIGDLRFGSDALYLKRHGARAMATDIDDARLKLAQSRGYFTGDEISAQNVESLKFADESFDYVLCKEAFHHFPRPMVGFYEMLRVAKRALLLIEPQDVQNPVVNATVVTSYHADFYHDSFEQVGNFKYTVSVREILKAAWSLKLKTVAVRGFNDHFVPDMTWDIFINRVNDLNGMGFRGERQFNLVALIVFKDEPDANLIDEMEQRNFTVFKCPGLCGPDP